MVLLIHHGGDDEEYCMTIYLIFLYIFELVTLAIPLEFKFELIELYLPVWQIHSGNKNDKLINFQIINGNTKERFIYGVFSWISKYEWENYLWP